MFPFRLLSIPPIVRIGQTRVVVSTSVVIRLLTLFLTLRRVEVCSCKQIITIITRKFYFFVKEIILRFDQVQCFEYSFEQVEDVQLTSRRQCYSNDMFEIFTIKAVMKDGTSHIITKYYGEGTRDSFGFFDTQPLDFAGSQADDSRQLIEALSACSAIPVGKRLTKIADYKNLLICADCGRSTKNTFKKCQYCGGQLC